MSLVNSKWAEMHRLQPRAPLKRDRPSPMSEFLAKSQRARANPRAEMDRIARQMMQDSDGVDLTCEESLSPLASRSGAISRNSRGSLRADAGSFDAWQETLVSERRPSPQTKLKSLYPSIKTVGALPQSDLSRNDDKEVSYPNPGVKANGYTFGRDFGRGGRSVITTVVDERGKTFVARLVPAYERNSHGELEPAHSAINEIEFWKAVEAAVRDDRELRAAAERLLLLPVQTFVMEYPQATLAFVMERAVGDACDVAANRNYKISMVIMLADMCAGIDFLHRVLHRAHCDFKPENVLVMPDGQGVLHARVADIEDTRPLCEQLSGRSDLRLLEQGTMPDDIYGTHIFMPPEVCEKGDDYHYQFIDDIDDSDLVRSEVLGASIDWYSVGVSMADVFMSHYAPDVRIVRDRLPLWFAATGAGIPLAQARTVAFSRTLQNGGGHSLIALPLLNSSIDTRRALPRDTTNTIAELLFVRDRIVGLTAFDPVKRLSCHEVIEQCGRRWTATQVEDMSSRVQNTIGSLVSTSGLGQTSDDDLIPREGSMFPHRYNAPKRPRRV